MKNRKALPVLLACALLLAGCGVSAQAAYEKLLSGDLSLFDPDNARAWALEEWIPLLLSTGGLEYTLLDLDGDGTEELLLQQEDNPSGYNGVFHFDGKKLYCWQNDGMEASCWDYPLQDGTMVRQYDFGGGRSYRVFRYQADGTEETLWELFAREELLGEDSAEPCPYYQIDGEEVDQETFAERLEALVTSQILPRSAWGW